MNQILEISIVISVFFIICGVVGLLFRCRLRSSDEKWKRIIGVNLKFEFLVYMVIFFLLSNILIYRDNGVENGLILEGVLEKTILIGIIVTVVVTVFRIADVIIKSTKNDDRFNRDTIVVTFQTIILVDVVVGVVGILMILGLNSENVPALAICATILTYVFRDIIRDVFAFYYLRKNGLIRIGDWIKLPKHGVDGEIYDVSLLSVSIKNWDTTITTLPTFMLQNEVMQNLQNMVNGRTPGRLLERTFYVDILTIRMLDMNEIDELRSRLEKMGDDVLYLKDVNSPTLNIKIFRLYLRHWLSTNDNVSHHPYLFVRLMDPTAYGLPVQIYTYLVETSWMHFDKVQCEIMEHVIEAMSWFGMRQFQRDVKHDVIDFSNKGKSDD